MSNPDQAKTTFNYAELARADELLERVISDPEWACREIVGYRVYAALLERGLRVDDARAAVWVAEKQP